MVLSFPYSTFVIVASAEDYHNTWVLIEAAVAGDKRQQGDCKRSSVQFAKKRRGVSQEFAVSGVQLISRE